MRFSKEKMAGSNNRKKPCGLLLLLAFGMAVMCAVVLHQLREGRVLSLQLQERDQQLITLQFHLQKERENKKEMKRKINDMKAKIFSLRNQEMELTDKLIEIQNTAAQLKKLKAELEAALVEKQIQIDKLTEKTEEFMLTNLKVSNLTSLLKQKEAEVEEMKKILTKKAQVENSTAQNEKSQMESFSISEERKGELDKFQTKMDEVDLKTENLSSKNQQEAEQKLKFVEENQTFGIKEVNGTEDGHANVEGSEFRAKNGSENAVISISSGQIQYELTKFSIDNNSTADSESSDRNFSSSKKDMKGNEKVRDKMGDENQEAKNENPEEDQRETDNENSKEEGKDSISKDLQLQETSYSESSQSSQENGDGFTEQKEAGKEVKSIGSKTNDEKQAENLPI